MRTGENRENRGENQNLLFSVFSVSSCLIDFVSSLAAAWLLWRLDFGGYVMLQVSLARLKQGHRTIPYPKQEPVLPDRFRGLPVVDSSKCADGCRACAESCPTNAIMLE